jgi:transcription elongation factor GreA
VSVTFRAAGSQPARNGGSTEVVLTPEGYAKLEEEHRHLTGCARAAAGARLSEALQVAGDLADNPEYLDAQNEVDVLEKRISILESRLHAARVLRPDELSSRIASFGSTVVLEDLDDGAREEYVLVSSAESDPSAGRLSSESPVGRAIAGHREGDVVDARAPHLVRHLRIVELHAARPGPERPGGTRRERA